MLTSEIITAYRRIQILGASEPGTTTLAPALSRNLSHSHLDTEDFYWEKKYS
jgi:adenylate kinase family enzyme